MAGVCVGRRGLFLMVIPATAVVPVPTRLGGLMSKGPQRTVCHLPSFVESTVFKRNANQQGRCLTGMKDGQKILFHGEGDQEPELEPGDVITVLDQKDHSVFQRRGHDLITKMKIQLSEALCGFKKTIKTLDDRILVITSKSGKVSEARL